jgi:hypothetical protein
MRLASESYATHALPESSHLPEDDTTWERGTETVSLLVAKLEPLLRAGDEGNWRDMVCVRKLAALKERLLEERQREQRQQQAATVPGGYENDPTGAQLQAQTLHTVNAALDKINRRFEYMRQQGHNWGYGSRIAEPLATPWNDVWHAPPVEAALGTSASRKVRVLRRNNSALRLALAGSLFIDRLDVEGPQGRNSPAGEGVRDAVLYEYMDAAEFRQRQLLEIERARRSESLDLDDDASTPQETGDSEDSEHGAHEHHESVSTQADAGHSDPSHVVNASPPERETQSNLQRVAPSSGIFAQSHLSRIYASTEEEYREQLMAASLLTSLDRRRRFRESSAQREPVTPSLRSESTTTHTDRSAEDTQQAVYAMRSQSPAPDPLSKAPGSTDVSACRTSGVSSGSSTNSAPLGSVQELGGSGRYRPGSNAAPSRFCHVCARTKDLQTCANLPTGCRKVTCAKCFEDHGWVRSDAWVCTHCRGVCPERSQCQIYRLSNRNRSAKNRRHGQGRYAGARTPAAAAATTASTTTTSTTTSGVHRKRVRHS